MLLSELGQPLFKIGGQLLRGFRKACRRRPCALRQRTPSAALAAGRRIDRLAELAHVQTQILRGGEDVAQPSGLRAHQQGKGFALPQSHLGQGLQPVGRNLGQHGNDEPATPGGLCARKKLAGQIAVQRVRKLPLTAAELQVLRLICADKSNAEIGQIMDIKLPTVKTHVSHILDKLDVRRRSEAKTAAKRLRLIPEER